MQHHECLGTFWVCASCVEADDGQTPQRSADEPETWALIGDDIVVTSGMLSEEHECDDRSEGCDCEIREFSKSSCDGCGSTLHGTREAFTLWKPISK